MDRLEKSKGAIRLKAADAQADIALINRYSVKELAPEDVYCFSVVLCDNDADRDLDRFTDEALEQLAPLFVGKTVISDHCWSADRQIARIYKTFVADGGAENSLGEPLKCLVASAYMLKTVDTQPVIDAIDGGIMKEVSIGCSVGKTSCSLCGEAFSLNLRTWEYECPNGHVHGNTYDGRLCVRQLEEPKDAYEVSFVAVPAQRSAGVTKSLENVKDAIALLKKADLGSGEVRELIKALQIKLQSAEDREARQRILAENQKFLKG